MKVRNPWPFALILKAGTTVLAQRQFAAADSANNSEWHEQVLRYTTGASVPAGSLQVVLLAGTIPPPGGGGGTDSVPGGDDAHESEEPASPPASAQAAAAEGGPDEEPDAAGYVRFDDVRLTKSPALPRHLFHGAHWLSETGLYDHHARLRDPRTNVFLSTDPARDGTNDYLFVGNNPMMYADPTGLFRNTHEAVPMWASAAAAGAFSFAAAPSMPRNVSASTITQPSASGQSSPWRHLGEVDHELKVLDDWWAGKYLSPGQSVRDHYHNRYTHFNYYVNRRSDLLAAQQRFQGGYDVGHITLNPIVEQISTRAGGLAQASFAGASLFVTIPAALTGVGATATAFSLDNLQAGLRTLATGQYTQTINAGVVSSGLQAAGMSQPTADVAGEVFNGVGSAGSGYLAARNLPQLTTISQQRLDTVSRVRVTVDPSTVGTIGGNIRFSLNPVVQEAIESGQLTVVTPANAGLGGVGGRLGNAATRDQVARVAKELAARGWRITGGGGARPEEFIRGPLGTAKGGAYPDITAVRNGRIIRVNTYTTLSDGITPTADEAARAANLRSLLKPGEHLLMVPKGP